MESYWHHRQMIQAIEEAPLMGVTLILLPPEHGKSTTCPDATHSHKRQHHRKHH